MQSLSKATTQNSVALLISHTCVLLFFSIAYHNTVCITMSEMLYEGKNEIDNETKLELLMTHFVVATLQLFPYKCDANSSK
jgi:hypothetical protein